MNLFNWISPSNQTQIDVGTHQETEDYPHDIYGNYIGHYMSSMDDNSKATPLNDNVSDRNLPSLAKVSGQ